MKFREVREIQESGGGGVMAASDPLRGSSASVGSAMEEETHFRSAALHRQILSDTRCFPTVLMYVLEDGVYAVALQRRGQ